MMMKSVFDLTVLLKNVLLIKLQALMSFMVPDINNKPVHFHNLGLLLEVDFSL